jgi:hypothetical protein
MLDDPPLEVGPPVYGRITGPASAANDDGADGPERDVEQPVANNVTGQTRTSHRAGFIRILAIGL